jgi:Na+-driven multidrug efflux pump
MKHTKLFFQYVIPSIFSFALSGVYAIVDGFFVGNTIGDAGLSAINIAYPIVAVLQSVGTGIGMSGAVYCSIHQASGNPQKAKAFIANAWWLLVAGSVLFTILVYTLCIPVLKLLGAHSTILSLGTQYIQVIALGAALQILGTGLVPFTRNYGGSLWAMIAMMSGFAANIFLDYLLVWVRGQGMSGAALATVIGQGVTVLIALGYSLYKKCFFLRFPLRDTKAFPFHFQSGPGPFRPRLDPEYFPGSHQSIFCFLWRRTGYRRLRLHFLYYLYRLSDFARRGRWLSAFDEPVLW